MPKKPEKALNRKAMRAEALLLLGGCCAVCKSVSNLEFDHIDPETKTLELSKHWGKQKALKEALDKCQILCYNCHVDKTNKERAELANRYRHGTRSGYRYCVPPRCDLCKEYKRLDSKAYRERNKASQEANRIRIEEANKVKIKLNNKEKKKPVKRKDKSDM